MIGMKERKKKESEDINQLNYLYRKYNLTKGK